MNAPQRAAAPTTRVLAVSVDGLNPSALGRLGRDLTPSLHRLMDEGAFTLNARAQVEKTLTLPNHTSMVTGRRIDASRGGHGVTWNEHRRGSTVQKAAGHGVASVFTVAHTAGSTALFTTKKKFSIFERSWDAGIDRFTNREADDRALVQVARADLIHAGRVFTFVHFSGPDVVGHKRGFMSQAYLRAVTRVDRLVGSLIGAIETHESLADTVVVLTADHGGRGEDHSDPRRYANYRVPFVVWGAGVRHGNLYAMNPTYADPGRRRVYYAGRQPVRNGDLANLSLDLLGLGPVPDSKYDVRQRLQVGPN